MGLRSDIGVQNVQKILFGADKGRSHKTSRSHNRGSFIAGTTVMSLLRWRPTYQALTYMCKSEIQHFHPSILIFGNERKPGKGQVSDFVSR